MFLGFKLADDQGLGTKGLEIRLQSLEIYSPMVLEIPGLFSSPYYTEMDYP